jgi:GWxTD domain-containing protein
MRKLVVVVVVAAAVLASPLLASDPAAELARGRTAIAKRDYHRAAEILRTGIESAERLNDKTEKAQALAALHFYAAVATYHTGRPEKARAHLTDFFEYQPNATRADPQRFEPGFVTLFNQVRTGRKVAGTASFDTLYPNFESASAKQIDPVRGWRNSAAFAHLATPDEKNAWDRILDPAERDTFVVDFWKKRDPTPGDDRNEFRDEFEARAAFADYYFGALDVRGSLSDRGKVFVLLGKPGAIESRGFLPSDGYLSLAENMDFGDVQLEIWRYPRTALPVAIPTVGVTYMFVTHRRIGDHLLHGLSGMNQRALLAAAESPLKTASNP